MTIEKVINCARCGETHTNVQMNVLSGTNPHYTHFAMCPTKNEPILLKVEEDLGEDVMIISHKDPNS